MSNSEFSGANSSSPESDTEAPLLQDTVNGGGIVDYRGRPVDHSNSGGWRSACFIIGVEVVERFAYYGIFSNLITYLTGSLGQSTVTAAENVNAWSGIATMLPLLGACIADSFLGPYRTIVVASLIYIVGLGMLTLSAMLPSLGASECQNTNNDTSCSPQLQVIFFFLSLYLVAIGQGGHQPCVQAFGADQFDEHHPEECKARSSFFNWCYFAYTLGLIPTLLILNYVQDNISWGLGFGIPCIAMVIGLVLFLLGTPTYRYSIKEKEKSPFVRIGGVFVAALKNWRTTTPEIVVEEEFRGTLTHHSSQQFKFLNKALVATDTLKEEAELCSVDEVVEAKAVLRLLPIWTTSLVYAIVCAQNPTFFTKQGATLDRTLVPGFDIPPAALQCFIGIGVVTFIPIYDRIFVPIARALTSKPSGITTLQRIGIGMFLSIISMVVAALVEMKRLKTVQEYGLVDMQDVTIPMSVWWIAPQYFLCGVTIVFTNIGLQEFFYDEVPNDLRSVGISLYLSILGIGSFLSSFMVSVINKATSGDDKDGWFSDNLNNAHLDYFYWLLSGFSAVGFATYLYFGKSYIYKS